MSYCQIVGGPRAFRFRTVPNSFEWEYRLNTRSEDTYGGRVIQLLSVSVDTLRLQVEAGNGGLEYLWNTVKYFRELAIWQRDRNQAVRLQYPYRRYDFSVYFQGIDWGDSLQNVLTPFSVTFQVEEENSSIVQKKIITNELTRLAQGIGYTQNEYNTELPLPPVGGGGGGEAAAGTDGEAAPGSSAPGVPTGGRLNMKQIVATARAGGFPSNKVALASAVAMAESSGDSQVVNRLGCTGLWQIYVKMHHGTYPWITTQSMKNPLLNAKAAVKISSNGSNWQPWEAYTNGSYRKFLAQAQREAGSG